MPDVRLFGNAPRGDSAGQAFLERIAPAMESFAYRHSLTIWKYPHHQPIWMFHFLHPKGGFGWLQLYCDSFSNDPKSVRAWIQGEWYVDEHARNCRLVSSIPSRKEIEPDNERIVDALESLLSSVIEWPKSSLMASDLALASGQTCSDFELSLRIPT